MEQDEIGSFPLVEQQFLLSSNTISHFNEPVTPLRELLGF
jgi:hypothetical protein